MISRKWKAKIQISIEKPGVPGWRPAPSVLFKPRLCAPKFEKGYPVFDEQPDLPRKAVSGQRKYRPPIEKPVFKTDHTESNFHEMQGRFRFEILGRFAEAGEVFEKQAFKAADDLYLGGYIKSRGSFVKGDLQGDVYALSHMQKWIKQGHHSADAGQVTSVRIFDENFGIPELPRRHLTCVKDWRKFYTKRDQMKEQGSRVQVEELKKRSLEAHAKGADTADDDSHSY